MSSVEGMQKSAIRFIAKNIPLITISLAFHRQRFGSLNRNVILQQLLLRLSYRILIAKVFRGQIKLNSFILTFEFDHR